MASAAAVLGAFALMLCPVDAAAISAAETASDAPASAARTVARERVALNTAAVPVPVSKPERKVLKPRRSPFGVLGSIEFKAGRLSAIREWALVRGRIAAERRNYAHCDAGDPRCPAHLKDWRKKLVALKGLPKREQMRRLNRFVNRSITYRTDDVRFGKVDYWASPGQVMGSAGDCEDYSVVKFFSLLDLGFSNDQIRIVVVMDTIRKIGHAVLAVELDNKTFIMDSLFDEPVPHQYVLQYEAVYSVNLTTRWAHITTPDIKRKFVAQYVNGDRSNSAQQSSDDRVVRLAD